MLSGLMLIASACPQISRVTEFTWFGPAQVQLQILGFFAIIMFGAIYELLPRVMGFGLPFPKFVRLQHWLFMLGIVLWAGSLAVGGVEQGMKLNNPDRLCRFHRRCVDLSARRHDRPAVHPARQPAVCREHFCHDIQVETRAGQNADCRRNRRSSPLEKRGGEIMKNGFSVFLAVFIALGLSWCGFVLGPVKQLGTAKQAAVLNSSDIYPLQRTGDATLGLQVYRANGCAACHTEQVRQDGVGCEVVLTGAGKNPTVVSNLVSTLKLTGLTKEEADAGL